MEQVWREILKQIKLASEDIYASVNPPPMLWRYSAWRRRWGWSCLRTFVTICPP